MKLSHLFLTAALFVSTTVAAASGRSTSSQAPAAATVTSSSPAAEAPTHPVVVPAELGGTSLDGNCGAMSTSSCKSQCTRDAGECRTSCQTAKCANDCNKTERACKSDC